MNHFETLRFVFAERLIVWAFNLLPAGSREQRELACFVRESWIGKPGGQWVSTNRPLTPLQQAFQNKLNEK